MEKYFALNLLFEIYLGLDLEKNRNVDIFRFVAKTFIFCSLSVLLENIFTKVVRLFLAKWSEVSLQGPGFQSWFHLK